MNRQKLHTQADKIEYVLATHKAPARVTGGRVTPRTIQFHVSPSSTTKVSQVEKLAEEVALALNASTVRISRTNGQINIEIPRDDVQPLRLLELAQQVQKDAAMAQALSIAGTTLLGMGVDGVPILLRVSAPDVAHVLIAGTTGSGKSEAARTMLASLMLYQRPRDVQVIIVDPKASEFRQFEQLPHLLCPIIKNVEDAVANLEWLVEEMTRRQEQLCVRPRIVLMIDELADLLMQGGAEAESYITRLVQRGRSAGISVIACTQKPTASVLGSLVKANFPVRLVGKVTSANEALVASGIAQSGAEKLMGRGDFVLIANGEKFRIQMAHLPAPDYDSFRAQILGTPSTRNTMRQMQSPNFVQAMFERVR
ncbi:MAG: DNA translocase FtsK [Chloroflexota bacterium]|nr:MAG: DNA translocase FtsK [Chloroflexota bacterium]